MCTRSLLGPTKRRSMTRCSLQFQFSDGDRTQCEQWLDDMDQATRISGRDLRTKLIKKSTGVVRNVHHDGTSRYI